MIVYEKFFYSRTRSSHYIESFVRFLASWPHIWSQDVVCIKCGSMWVGIYTRKSGFYHGLMIAVTL